MAWTVPKRANGWKSGSVIGSRSSDPMDWSRRVQATDDRFDESIPAGSNQMREYQRVLDPNWPG